MKRILVTGAKGRVGRCVARRLCAESVELRVLRRAPPAPDEVHVGEVVIGDFSNETQMALAFGSMDAVFMYAPDASASDAVFRAARQAGVRQVVLLSSAAVTRVPPGVNPIAERHRIAENAAQAAGMNWTFIRPDSMASNCLQWTRSIREERRVYVPYPGSMRCAVHEDDIALLAVQCLLSERYSARTVEVTGGEVLRIHEQVQCIASHLGTRIECVTVSEQDALHRMQAANQALSLPAARRLLDYLKKSVTVAPRISDEFSQFTGRASRSFGDWVRDNIDHFLPCPGAGTNDKVSG